MNKIERLIVDKILEWKFAPNERKKYFLKEQALIYQVEIRKPENYLCYEYSAGKITKLIFAQFSDTPFELDRIEIGCFYFDNEVLNKKNICNELVKVRDFFKPKRLKVVIGARENQKKLLKILKTLSFTSNGIKLVAKTSDSLNFLQRTKLTQLNETMSIEKFEYKKHLDDVLKIEYRAHNNEPSSVVYKFPKKHWGFFKDYLINISKDGTSFILKDKNKIIGFVGYEIKKNMPSGSIIVSISLLPKYKGQGLSKHLYLTLLKDMKKHRIDTYYGYTKTNQVLGFSKKLKRHPCFYSLKLDKIALSKL